MGDRTTDELDAWHALGRRILGLDEAYEGGDVMIADLASCVRDIDWTDDER